MFIILSIFIIAVITINVFFIVIFTILSIGIFLELSINMHQLSHDNQMTTLHDLTCRQSSYKYEYLGGICIMTYMTGVSIIVSIVLRL